MSRLNAIAPAVRPKMWGRAMITGPSGAGKTWTALSVAKVLADGDLSKVLLIDTERESALTYADVYPGFAHLPWRPPYDPSELTTTLGELGDSYEVVIVDSLSHFWRGEGGTLDIADGKIGGWKNARPVQERMVQAILATQAHVILCVRSKMEYLVENGGRSVTKVGMNPIQDDTLLYEVNVAADLDTEHRLTVTKSRTAAVPVGRMYPAGHESKMAADYAAWLAGGVPPAPPEKVAEVVEAFGSIVDEDARTAVKKMFVEFFGMPQSLTVDQVDEALEWALDQAAAHADPVAAEPPEPDPLPDEQPVLSPEVAP